MRHHLRFLLMCSLVAVAAGCSNSDKDGNGGSNNALSPAAELCGSIGDRVWLDENGNGVQDGSEPGVPGVTVEAEVCGGSLAATTTTDANGNYLFANLDDNVSYRLCFFAPPGYAWTTPNQGGVEQTDSDVMADGCLNACVILNDCKAPRYVDAGLRRTDETEGCASIGDRVWFDTNCNGVQDQAEPGAPGVTVRLETCDGRVVATTVTNASGNYLFDPVDENFDYRVCFELPDGYTFSPANQGIEGMDSDAGPDGCTPCMDVGHCKAPRWLDAGLCQEEDDDFESCSPGFWKNHYAAWGPTGYSPNDVFDDVFGCDIFGDDTTLGEAIHIEDTHNVLAFHAVAALLNATHPDLDNFPYTADQVKDLACDRNKEALSDSVNDNCNLSADNNHGDDDDDDDDHNGDDDDDDDDDDDGGHKDKD